ncbi:carbohydrate esterase family 3 protein [Xylariaceae sp. FL0255]|nr:carbohydrate esterase family 3 protein [Xylariaceae sp. FL0255]
MKIRREYSHRLWACAVLLAQDARDNTTAFADGTPLRIMPLGASITWGYLSTDGNGYRKEVRDQLVAAGATVNMVGSREHGNMTDNQVEGWPGYTIEMVHEKANIAVPKYLPNVVLLNVGTNDVSENVNLTGAGDRMTNLINDIYHYSPSATVILSTLVVRSNHTDEERVLDVNAQYRAVATSLIAKKRRLVLVDMQPPAGPAVNQLVDGTHPNDAGYAKMGEVWFSGFQEADKNGFLVAPEA